jgi:N-acetylneuraminate synthase
LDRNSGIPDDSFSLELKELKELCAGAKTALESLGSVNYGRKSSEQDNLKFRRSLYAFKDIQSGESFTKDNVRPIRPGFGLPPKNINKVLSLKSVCYISRGTPIKWELTEKI